MIIIDTYLSCLFICNFVLVIVDATLGYYIAPLIVRQIEEKPQIDTQPTTTIRRALAAVVAFYIFLDCLAYNSKEPTFLLIVTGIVILDIICQLFIRRKFINKTR